MFDWPIAGAIAVVVVVTIVVGFYRFQARRKNESKQAKDLKCSARNWKW